MRHKTGAAKVVSDVTYVNSKKLLEKTTEEGIASGEWERMPLDLAFHFRVMKIAGNCNLIVKNSKSKNQW